MTKEQFIRLFEHENGYTPDEETINLCMHHYDIEDEPREQRNVYQFARKSYTSDTDSSASDLLKEIRNIFAGIAGSAQKSSNRDHESSNKEEFTFMVAIFLCKTSLYFLLKEAYNKGYDFANL